MGTRAEAKEALATANEAAEMEAIQTLKREAYERAWSQMPPGYTGTAWVEVYHKYLERLGLGPRGKPLRRPN